MDTPCYCAALRGAARKATAIYDDALAPTGVNVAQFSLMRKIERTGAISLTELARVAELDRSTVGRNVKVLQRLRFVRVDAADDRREAAVRLTQEGADTLRQATPLWRDAQRRIEATLGAGAEALRVLAASL